MAAERHDTAFVVGAIVGGLAGAAITLFNVPQSGARTRAQVIGQARTLTRGLTDAVARLGDGAEGLLVDTAGRISSRPGGAETESVAAPEVRTGPLAPATTEAEAAALAFTPLTGAGEIDVVIDGPRPASPESQG